jgi:hypothetical protein
MRGSTDVAAAADPTERFRAETYSILAAVS